MEPKDYFEDLKTQVRSIDEEQLKVQLGTINDFMVRANEIDQKNFLHKLVFARETIVKEQQLLINGIDRYVIKEDISKFISKVTPKNSVKIIELARFPRAIPINCLDAIKAAKELNLFDDFCVVFTDFTEQKYETPEEKAYVAKNRDPIVFGYFHQMNTGLKHERFYFITDWEDEFCDLTFSKMLELAHSMGIPNMEKKVAYDEKYLTQICTDVREEIENAKVRDERRFHQPIPVLPERKEAKKFSLFSKIKDFFYP